jgi:hypothetical protein
MKKIFKLAVLAAAMAFSANAGAQLRLGVKGGLNITNFKLSSEMFKTENRTGYFIGPTIKLTMPTTGIGFDAAALYDKREAKVEKNGTTIDGTIKQEQIVFPINVRYAIGLGESADIFVFAGPQFGFNIGSKDKDLIKGVAEWRLKSSNFSVNLGFGATIFKYLQLSANYNIICGKTGDVTVDGVKKSYEGSNNAWQISAAYYF